MIHVNSDNDSPLSILLGYVWRHRMCHMGHSCISLNRASMSDGQNDQ